MLIEFSAENFRSIKEKVTLSLVASPDKSLDNNLIKKTLKKDDLLRSAVIYGANASGKTNVILAINFLRALVINSHTHQKGMGIKFTPFKLDKKCLTKPTKFEIIFIKDKTKYNYNVSFNHERIIDEELYYYPNDRKALIFERKNTKSYIFKIDTKDQKFISKRTLDNVLYLSKATQENYKKTSAAFDWLKNDLQFVGPYQPGLSEEFTINLLNENKELKKLILKSLLEADVGIDNISASVKKIEKIPENIPSELLSLIKSSNNTFFKETKIKTFHKDIEFDFYREESEGTKRMFSLMGHWIDALKNGRVLVLDELDTKLHHLLNVFLIKLFNDPTQNKGNGQLIFTTHNTNLLDQDLFRRDQIWFTEKNNKIGSTDLYSLIEYSPRKDKDIERGYLAGRYGALPFIGENKIF